MKLVSKALSERDLSVKELSPQLQNEIESLKGLILKYNEACDEFDEDSEVGEDDKSDEKELDEMESYISNTENELADKILKFKVPSYERPIREEKPTREVKETAQEASNAIAADVEKVKKEGSSVGWLIFGGIVLVATVGMVNVFNKK